MSQAITSNSWIETFSLLRNRVGQIHSFYVFFTETAEFWRVAILFSHSCSKQTVQVDAEC